MRTLCLAAIASVVILAMAPGSVEAQVPETVYEFDLVADQTMFTMEAATQVEIPLTFYDLSKDSSNAVAPGTGVVVVRHITKLHIEFLSENLTGFDAVVIPATPIRSAGGEVHERMLQISTTLQVREETYRFRLVAETDVPNGTSIQTIDFAVVTPGPATFNAQAAFSELLAPGTISSFPILVQNHALVPREFIVEQTGNDCDMSTAYERSVLVQPKTQEEVWVDFRTPSGKLWYFSQLCPMSFQVAPADLPAQARTVIVSPQINGLYVNPMWTFTFLAAVTAIALVAFFVRRRKEILEEEILGKPQKPWTIPTERVYLEHLEAKDPRAAYVVRHFLMEEEYQSALLWYRNYKRATRGERAKEALVVGQEKKYERFKRQWEKRIAAPLLEADKYETQLQRKLDRQAKKDVRKQRRAWKKIVAKLEQATEAQNAKATAKWEKAAAKAEKKGQPVPSKPTLLVPDLPPEPQLEKIQLADHKLAKKAAKFRKKMVKRQGNLEVKFEKKDARMLHKLRRKVQKIARKLDDPAFVNEHPLLTG